ncbi:hypothetical protein S83_032597, partial [Arachis hypogaea]
NKHKWRYLAIDDKQGVILVLCTRRRGGGWKTSVRGWHQVAWHSNATKELSSCMLWTSISVLGMTARSCNGKLISTVGYNSDVSRRRS